MRNGHQVAAFESAFAEYVGAKYAIALCNGTATLHTALVALGVKPGDRVAVPPLTMSATTIAVLQSEGIPVFVDIDPETWLMRHEGVGQCKVAMPVSLYGLHYWGVCDIDDAAQTLRPHNNDAAFTSYSFQASKVLALGEGGMLTTDSEELATRARSFSSLGYRLDPKSPRIDPAILKSPDYERHHLRVSWNYRMNDITAAEGLRKLDVADRLKANRFYAAVEYQQAIKGCDWIERQAWPEGWTHDYWCYAVAVKDKELQPVLSDAIVRHGGERPYGAWRLSYQEPAFRHIAEDGTCPVAEDLQPRLLQLQTNDLASAEKNTEALSRAIKEIGGSR